MNKQRAILLRGRPSSAINLEQLNGLLELGWQFKSAIPFASGEYSGNASVISKEAFVTMLVILEKAP